MSSERDLSSFLENGEGKPKKPVRAVHPVRGVDRLFKDDREDREIDPEILAVMREDMVRIGKRNSLLSALVLEQGSTFSDS